MTDIDGEHGGRSALEQHLAESAGRGPGVESDTSARIDAEPVERRNEFVGGSTDVVICTRDDDDPVGTDAKRRLDLRNAVDRD